jgi:hypothetical protein
MEQMAGWMQTLLGLGLKHDLKQTLMLFNSTYFEGLVKLTV